MNPFPQVIYGKRAMPDFKLAEVPGLVVGGVIARLEEATAAVEEALNDPLADATALTQELDRTLLREETRCDLDLPPSEVYSVIVGDQLVYRCYHNPPHELLR